MLPQADAWECEVECAFRLLETEGAAAFRVGLERLGFVADEIDRFVSLERGLAEARR